MTSHGSFRLRALLFAATVFVSAFLLFQIQPLISKCILPWFGGTPNVWTTCMLFFQAALFGGYAYAHLLTSRLSPRAQAAVHVTLIACAAVSLRVLPGAAMKPDDAGASPVGGILLLLFTTVGLPYFVLSSTGPLLQAWFGRTNAGTSPYRLYALSNTGSLLALLSYPFVFEPLMTMSQQAAWWSTGFWMFAALCAGCGVVLARTSGTATIAPTPAAATLADAESGAASDRPTPLHCLAWFGLSAVASVVLLAMTNQVCLDVAVIPFLWVLPLSLYLLSFILCFDSDRWYSPRAFAIGGAGSMLCVSILMYSGAEVSISAQLTIYLGALFFCCMTCHGELVRLKPASRWLTSFYLTLAAGGAFGGLFVGLIAPLIFPTYLEMHLSVFAATAIALGVWYREPSWLRDGRRPRLVGAAFAFILVCLATTLTARAGNSLSNAIAVARSFYGVLHVEPGGRSEPNRRTVNLRHGRIVHGVQFQSAARRRTPTTYYGASSGVGRVAAVLRDRQTSLRIGVVGLGVGTMAAYAEEGDSVRMYEINEQVVQLAGQHFTFLRDCPVAVEIVLGDGRLSLEREAPQGFDLLVLDAFSGDAIPVHLLTRESLGIYRRHLAAGGVLAVHISNHHVDLRPVTDALADDAGLARVTLLSLGDDENGESPSQWVLMTTDASLLTDLRIAALAEPSQPRRALWTDDFSNLFELLK